MKEKYKVKVIAIAKDEAAYIPEWVHHHLYFGFDGIEIIINRTADNSIKVLEKIREKNTRVEYSHCDWIDLCNPSINIKMQEIAYAHACVKAEEDGFTHVLLIDVDEFWTPKDFDVTIHDCLDRFPNPSSVSFNWLCELGDEKEFAEFPHELNYFVSTHLKTLSFIKDIKEIRIHTPVYLQSAKHFMGDGEKFVPKKNAEQFYDGQIKNQEDFFIVHRLYRSEMEYIALLYRGNPDSKVKGESDIKLNRHGYNFNQGSKHKIIFPENKCNEYFSRLERFISSCELEIELDTARSTVRLRAAECVKVAEYHKHENTRVLQQVFYGCKDERIVRMLNNERRIVSCIDVSNKISGGVSISGWAFIDNPLTDLRISVLSLDPDQQSVSKADRADVSRKFLGAPVDCGFDIRIKIGEMSAEEKTKLIIRIKEADLIRSFHNTYLLYDTEQQLLRHGNITDLRMKSWLKPIFASKVSEKLIMSILVNNEICALGVDGGKVKAMPKQAKLSKNTRLFEIKFSDKNSLVILHGECYTGAAPGGDVYFNRDIAKDWELFSLSPSPTGVSEDLEIVI